MRPRRRRPDLDRQVPRKRDERINEEIRAQSVRLVDENGGQVGILPTKEALEHAFGKGLDLVEVAAGADPPVARVMDYSKYRYEQDQRAKQARKHQQQI
ncbi:MAG TPA: translation initiation factor IF-3, partial [Gaiellaceae bacterium]|nr:translation initiation factor IF-3 [Gaiellaceae bacterium]